ncbi:MAG: hypothetical protein ACOCVE_03530, partial [Desulfovermiculus sp.]
NMLTEKYKTIPKKKDLQLLYSHARVVISLHSSPERGTIPDWAANILWPFKIHIYLKRTAQVY